MAKEESRDLTRIEKKDLVAFATLWAKLGRRPMLKEWAAATKKANASSAKRTADRLCQLGHMVEPRSWDLSPKGIKWLRDNGWGHLIEQIRELGEQ